MFDEAEYVRWIRSSKGTLNSARGDLERGDYNWPCFKAQQTAELAVKALLHGLGLPAHGHSVSGLFTKAPRDLGIHEVIQPAKTQDKYYVRLGIQMRGSKVLRRNTIQARMGKRPSNAQGQF